MDKKPESGAGQKKFGTKKIGLPKMGEARSRKVKQDYAKKEDQKAKPPAKTDFSKKIPSKTKPDFSKKVTSKAKQDQKELPKRFDFKDKDKKYTKTSGLKNRETKFMPLNTTNVTIVHNYFNDIHPALYDIFAKSNQYVLYQFEGKEYEIYMIPVYMSKLVKKLTHDVEIKQAGIHLGYMRRKMTSTGFERGFFLSYEGGEFLLSFIKQNAPNMISELQIINLDDQGEKTFLYGGDLGLDHVITDSQKIKKRIITFVHDRNSNYIGLGLLQIKQAGAKNPSDLDGGRKPFDMHSRSSNFILKILNLTDAGHYLRDGL